VMLGVFSACLVTGVLIIIVSLAANRRKGPGAQGRAPDGCPAKVCGDAAAEIESIIASGIEEFNRASASALAELECRYQELLILHQRADAGIGSGKAEPAADAASVTDKAGRERVTELKREPERELKNEREIRGLAGDGVPVSEIARRLGVGQGEVRMVLELRNCS